MMTWKVWGMTMRAEVDIEDVAYGDRHWCRIRIRCPHFAAPLAGVVGGIGTALPSRRDIAFEVVAALTHYRQWQSGVGGNFMGEPCTCDTSRSEREWVDVS